MNFDDSYRTVDEGYSVAVTSSNLTVDADRRGDADYLIAAGWNQQRIGGALLRLHTEAEQRSTYDPVQLRSWPSVERELMIQAHKSGLTPLEAKALVLEVVRWWLHKTCNTCHGTKYEAAPGTNRLTGKVCKACYGAGIRSVPGGEMGRWLAGLIDDCIERSHEFMRKRLRQTHC